VVRQEELLDLFETRKLAMAMGLAVEVTTIFGRLHHSPQSSTYKSYFCCMTMIAEWQPQAYPLGGFSQVKRESPLGEHLPYLSVSWCPGGAEDENT